MKEKDLKETIGKKLEEAYLAKPMGQAPSEETVAKWIAIADQRRAETRRRKTKIISCAAACALCVCIGVTCVVKPPNAVAGGSGGTKVETPLESVKEYSSLSELPNDIQKEFLFFSELEDNYHLVNAIVESINGTKKFTMFYELPNKEEVCVEQIKYSQNGNSSFSVDSDAVKELWNGIEVNIISYNNGEEETTYIFMYEDVLVTMNMPKMISKEEVKNMIEKAV